jgi:hypothetical protein
MMLTPIGTLLPQNLQDRGRHILDTLQGLPLEPQLDLACRTILAVLLTFQPASSAPKAKRDAFKTICDGVQVWLKEKIAKMRRTQPDRRRRHRRQNPGSEWVMRKSRRLLTVSPDGEPRRARWEARRMRGGRATVIAPSADRWGPRSRCT